MSTLHSLASRPIPTDVPALSVSPDGSLQARPDPLQIRFAFLGYQFSATVIQDDGPARLACSAVVGTLPFTVEGPERRARALAIIAHSQRARDGSRLSIDAHQRIHYGLELELLPPISRTSVIAAACDAVVAAQPWLALLAEHARPAARA